MVDTLSNCRRDFGLHSDVRLYRSSGISCRGREYTNGAPASGKTAQNPRGAAGAKAFLPRAGRRRPAV